MAYESKGDAANAIERYQESIAIGYDKPEIYRYIASLQNRKARTWTERSTTIEDGLTKRTRVTRT